jgi:hypothetical protein
MKKLIVPYNFKVCQLLLLSLIGLLALSPSAFAELSGDFAYIESGGSVAIVGYTNPNKTGAVVIPATIDGLPVVWILEGAFIECNLTSVTIPNSVKEIRGSSFYSCRCLTHVTIGSGVTVIGSDAFGRCYALTSVTIPSSVTSIGDGAFAYCAGLTRAYLLGNAPSIGNFVFLNCSSNFSICYTAGATGFTNPWWTTSEECYPAAVCAPTTTTTTIPPTQCAAEAIYGNDSAETELLREYRDKVLSKSETGRQIIKAYYELSPSVVEVLQNNDTARASTQKVLDSLMPAIRVKVKQ